MGVCPVRSPTLPSFRGPIICRGGGDQRSPGARPGRLLARAAYAAVARPRLAVIGAEFDAVLNGAKAGYEPAVRRLYRDLNPSLVRFLEAQVSGAGEDLAQEVWLAAAKSLASFTGNERGFRAWIFTIARRQVVGHWRRTGRRHSPATDPADLPERCDSSALEPDVAILADEAVQSLIEGLPREQAEIVLLRVLGGFDAEEVGAMVGKRASTVRVLQHRALRKMAQRFSTGSVTK